MAGRGYKGRIAFDFDFLFSQMMNEYHSDFDQD
ncbi:predicted protein [Sclerotinia sclerotiorum 1980 UF-70]|uniref:Uncharacterized protein n=1 Tax=Sclerotinia sclerotiorum (strain ATCC 18683 / 1980 / Ss-1) TaxID=665079 RepID=A7E746_SCLS1|nr:predicted protein [Sclerotinia sclerotiorum 1980 UF-70]EDN96198.1 predicted protein [Sclerotinia sclerotiorum 1980 UF-70]